MAGGPEVADAVFITGAHPCYVYLDVVYCLCWRTSARRAAVQWGRLKEENLAMATRVAG